MLLEGSFGLRLGRVGRETKVRLPFLSVPLESIGKSRNAPRVNSELTGDQCLSLSKPLLVPGCTESPTCQCGEEMDVATIEMLPEKEARTRLSGVYRCNRCHREVCA